MPSHGPEGATLIGREPCSDPSGSPRALALTILYHPVLDRVGDRYVLADHPEGSHLRLSRTEPAFAPPGRRGGAPLGDEHLSRRPLRLVLTEGGGARLEIEGSGTFVCVRNQRARGELSFSPEQIRRGVVLELRHRVVLLLHKVSALQDAVSGSSADDEAHGIAGESDAIRGVLWEISCVADLELPVLLRGETGSGKELVARALHRGSRRRDRPFVAVNLAAIPPSLAAAELFGAEKGAYTGSVRRQAGYFEQARGGTLFLDEIGEAPVELQAALLRALESGETQPVGAQEIRKADARVIAATDADLEGKVASGGFRAPLLSRLSAYAIWIPPLRERRDDLGRLFARFLREELERVGEERRLTPGPDGKLWLSASSAARLFEHDWPGNVRELRNVVRQIVIGNRGRAQAALPAAVRRQLRAPEAAPAVEAPASAPVKRASEDAGPGSAPVSGGPRRPPAEVTEAELAEALRASRWELAAAARRLGISRSALYVVMRRFPRIRTAGELTPEEITACHGACGGDVARMAERLEVSERALGRRVRELGL